MGGEMSPLKKKWPNVDGKPYIRLMVERNPVNSPVEVIGTYSPLFLQGFSFSTIPGGCLGLFPSTCMIFCD